MRRLSNRIALFVVPRYNEQGLLTVGYRSETTDRLPVLRNYTVFNVAQCDGLDAKIPEVDAEEFTEFQAISRAEEIVEAVEDRPEINHGTTAAFYRYADDSIGESWLKGVSHYLVPTG